MTKELITDPVEVLTMIDRQEIKLIKNWPVGGAIVDRFGLWRRVSRKFMRNLIGAGLVQPARLGWSNGDWIYRLTDLGRRLILQPELVDEAYCCEECRRVLE